MYECRDSSLSLVRGRSAEDGHLGGEGPEKKRRRMVLVKTTLAFPLGPPYRTHGRVLLVCFIGGASRHAGRDPGRIARQTSTHTCDWKRWRTLQFAKQNVETRRWTLKVAAPALGSFTFLPGPLGRVQKKACLIKLVKITYSSGDGYSLSVLPGVV